MNPAVNAMNALDEQAATQTPFAPLQPRSEDAAFLETLMANAPVGLAYLDAQLRFVRINQTLAAIDGCTVEEHIGRTLSEIHEDAKILIEPTMRRVLASAQPVVDVETSLSSNAGDDGTRHYLSSYSPVFNEAGRAVGVSVMVVDITDRKRADEARRRSEERYRAFVQKSSEAIWRFEVNQPIAVDLPEDELIERMVRDGYLAECNDAMAQMYGFAGASEIEGTPLVAFVDPAQARNREYLRSFVRSGFRLSAAESAESDLDGEVKYFQNHLVGVVEDGFLKRAWGTQSDITQKRQNEIELRESELRFRQLTESIDHVFYIREVHSLRFLYLSPTFERVTGHMRSEFKKEPHCFLEWVHPDDRALFEQFDAGFVQDETTVIEYRLLRPDGEVRWIHHRAFPVRDETGQVYRVAGIAYDITERKAHEQDAMRSRQFLQSTLDALAVHIAILDETGRIIAVNGAWRRFAGENQFAGNTYGIGLNYLRVCEVATGDFADEAPTVAHGIREVLAGRVPECYLEYPCHSPSDKRWFGIRITRFTESTSTQDEEADGPSRIVIAHENITVRKLAEEELRRERAQAQASEERFRFLAQAGEVLSASLDPEATFAAVANLVVPSLGDWCSIDLLEDNGSTRHVAIEHKGGRAHLGREIRQQFPPSLTASGTIGISNVLRTGRAEVFFEMTPALMQGMAQSREHFKLLEQTGIVSMMVVPLTVQGKVVGVLSIAASESERHYDHNDLALAIELARRGAQSMENARLHRDTQHALRAAEDASRAKDDFLATVSHELRTPLTAILGWANLLQSGGIDPETTQRALETIERNVHSQAQIIEDLLDVSRIVAGKLRLNIVPLDLRPVVQDAIDAAQPAIQAKNISLDLCLESQALISGDATRLQQIVWNLVCNAVKFTPKGGRISLSTACSGDHVSISVSDNGPGISAEFAPFVFDRFRQADSTATRRHGGLGLGLAIVRHLAEMHGGGVRLKPPVPGEGATFIVELPLLSAVEPDADQSTLEATAAHSESAKSLPLHDLRVLVVEDEADGRELIVALMQLSGAQVRGVGSAREGWDMFRDWRPDMLISDIGMPEEDGYSLMRRIRALPGEQGGQAPALALTAYAREEDRVQALAAGFNRHLSKPIEVTTLTHAVADLAAGSSSVAASSRENH